MWTGQFPTISQLQTEEIKNKKMMYGHHSISCQPKTMNVLHFINMMKIILAKGQVTSDGSIEQN
jgi:hypothetical protein